MQKKKSDSKQVSSTLFKVSDHARIRYIERVMGIDLKKIDNHILDSINMQIVDSGLSQCKFSLLSEPKYVVVLKGDTVVTVVDKKIMDYKGIPKVKRKR